jgi:hypothetical protein
LKKDDPATWDRCMFFLERKRRFCNMQRCEGLQHCGVHVNDGKTGASKANSVGSSTRVRPTLCFFSYALYLTPCPPLCSRGRGIESEFLAPWTPATRFTPTRSQPT